MNPEPKVLAGLAIHDDALYFHDSDPDRNIIIPLETGCVVNGSIKDFNMLESALTKLHTEAKDFIHQVSIGIPANDSIIRPIILPKMNLDDIYSTINLNFDEYFPFPHDEAVFDTMIVSTPDESPDNITVMTAAARRTAIDTLLHIARKASIPIAAIEPMNFAVIRPVPEIESGLCILAEANSIVTTWNGNAILFRANLNGTQEIMNTIQYIENQYRQRISHLILAGLNIQIGTENTIRLDDKFLAAKGLALRKPPAFDLRPKDFIESERKRHSFNPTGLAMVITLSCFLLCSIGTIGISIMKTRETIEGIARTKDNIEVMTQRRMELSKKNAGLEKQKAKTKKIIEFLQSDIPVLEVMNALEANAGTAIKFDDADFSRNKSIVTVVINGKSDDEMSVISLTEGLKASGLFSSVMLPISQRDKENRTVFKLILMIESEKL